MPSGTIRYLIFRLSSGYVAFIYSGDTPLLVFIFLLILFKTELKVRISPFIYAEVYWLYKKSLYRLYKNPCTGCTKILVQVVQNCTGCTILYSSRCSAAVWQLNKQYRSAQSIIYFSINFRSILSHKFCAMEISVGSFISS